MNVIRMKRVAILVAIVLVSMLPCAQAGRTIYGGQEKQAQDALYPYGSKINALQKEIKELQQVLSEFEDQNKAIHAE